MVNSKQGGRETGLTWAQAFSDSRLEFFLDTVVLLLVAVAAGKTFNEKILEIILTQTHSSPLTSISSVCITERHSAVHHIIITSYVEDVEANYLCRPHDHMRGACRCCP